MKGFLWLLLTWHGYFRSEDVVSCLLGTGCNAAPKQQTHVDAQPSTMFMSAGLD